MTGLLMVIGILSAAILAGIICLCFVSAIEYRRYYKMLFDLREIYAIATRTDSAPGPVADKVRLGVIARTAGQYVEERCF